jgi:hypothetical protein
MGKLTAEQKCASTIADKKPQGKVAHVPGVSPGRIHSNPINIMKNAERRSNQGYGIIDARPCLFGALLRNNGKPARVQAPNVS